MLPVASKKVIYHHSCLHPTPKNANLLSYDCLINTALSSHKSSALRHHVCVEDIATWNINSHDEHQEPFVILVHILLCMIEREVHEQAFGRDSDGIQDEECVVPVQLARASSKRNKERKSTSTTATTPAPTSHQAATQRIHIEYTPLCPRQTYIQRTPNPRIESFQVHPSTLDS